MWATSPVSHHEGFRSANNINGTLYGQFVQAIGSSLNGHYAAPNLNGKVAALPASVLGRLQQPNIGGWTTPQWQKVHGQLRRGLADDLPADARRRLQGLVATGHGTDTILIGETAAYGAGRKGYGASIDPLVFMRALYCVDGRYRPLAGVSAVARMPDHRRPPRLRHALIPDCSGLRAGPTIPTTSPTRPATGARTATRRPCQASRISSSGSTGSSGAYGSSTKLSDLHHRIRGAEPSAESLCRLQSGSAG